MNRTVLRCAFLAVAVTALNHQSASASWCDRVYTSYYVDPCVPCTVAPTACAPTACAPTPCATPCPTPQNSSDSCQTRCYLEPTVAYRMVTRLEPQTFFVRRSYYDPFTLCQRSYYTPATQFVQRSYPVPVTSYVQRCYSSPAAASNGNGARNGTTTPETNGGSNPDSSSSESKELDRPVYREPAPKNDAPKPVPMPAPQT